MLHFLFFFFFFGIGCLWNKKKTMVITKSETLLGDLGDILGFVITSRAACCPTVSLDWEDFLCVISFATAVLIFSIFCVLGQNCRARTPMMMFLLWRYDCTILMTCNDKSDVLYFLMSLFVSVSCIAFLVGPVSFSRLLCSRLRVAERDYTHICLLVMSQQVIFFFGHIYDFTCFVGILPRWEPRSFRFWALYPFGLFRSLVNLLVCFIVHWF